MKAPLECKVMNNVTTLSVFCVVKFSCSEMEEKKGLVLWGTHPPTFCSHLFFSIYLRFHTSSNVPPTHTTPLLPFFLPFSPLSLSQYTVSGLVYMARGKRRRGIVWIIYAGSIVHPRTRCLPSRFTPFVSLSFSYVLSVVFLLPVSAVQGPV